ncbi:ABC transporter permease [Nocardioides sp. AE5]|uniref:ABC transporter permease n=1 Tax=Nocardioides sp. AE5 TaxID=2962573 RepID=UPI002881F571|nr:ABC transporter permease [Nocardioides sp. AE5]MDT0201966.1 ABC transporter permease [Nocardioides sp. AE5]
MSAVVPAVEVPEVAPRKQGGNALRWLLWFAIGFVALALLRVSTGANDINSTGALRAALVASIPIALAGLGGLWSERAGVVNIGLEGMMIVGTLGAGYMGYQHGVIAGVLGALVFGAIGGVLHAVATVIFGVDHIVSGVAINIMAVGIAGFLAEQFFADLPGGGPTQSPPLPHAWSLNIGPLDDLCREMAGKGIFLVSDAFSLLGVLVGGFNALTMLALLLAVATWWILWHTAFGLRIRSVGESPSAAESLGVNVYFYKFVAVTVSGALAGLGGAYLAMVSFSGYQNGQTGGLGYIGLAALIFGNWRPGGLMIGAGIFGYTQAIQLRGGTESLHALLLGIAVALVCVAVWQARRRLWSKVIGAGLGALVFFVWFFATDEVPRHFTGMAPYVTTLLVLALFAQQLRMPAADGQTYRKGSAG